MKYQVREGILIRTWLIFITYSGVPISHTHYVLNQLVDTSFLPVNTSFFACSRVQIEANGWAIGFLATPNILCVLPASHPQTSEYTNKRSQYSKEQTFTQLLNAFSKYLIFGVSQPINQLKKAHLFCWTSTYLMFEKLKINIFISSVSKKK